MEVSRRDVPGQKKLVCFLMSVILENSIKRVKPCRFWSVWEKLAICTWRTKQIIKKEAIIISE